MSKERLLAFTDGVIAVVITIMVLELKAPHGDDPHSLLDLWPVFLGYVLSFIYVGIYWNNHHHFFQLVERIDGAIMWANLHLLFWISLIPFATAWTGEHGRSAVPTALYGGVLLMSAVAFVIMQTLLIRAQGPESALRRAIGSDWKGKLSPILYLIGIGAAFAAPLLADAVYVLVALLWLIPDRRMARAVERA